MYGKALHLHEMYMFIKVCISCLHLYSLVRNNAHVIHVLFSVQHFDLCPLFLGLSGRFLVSSLPSLYQ